MTHEPKDNPEERIAAILRSEAERVQPSADALEKIRERAARRRPAWVLWLRPAGAVAAALLIAGGILLGTPGLREQVMPSATTGAETTQTVADGATRSPSDEPPQDDAIGQAPPPAPTDEPAPTGNEDAPPTDEPSDQELLSTSDSNCPGDEDASDPGADASRPDDGAEDADKDCDPAEDDEPTGPEPSDDPDGTPTGER